MTRLRIFGGPHDGKVVNYEKQDSPVVYSDDTGLKSALDQDFHIDPIAAHHIIGKYGWVDPVEARRYTHKCIYYPAYDEVTGGNEPPALLGGAALVLWLAMTVRGDPGGIYTRRRDCPNEHGYMMECEECVPFRDRIDLYLDRDVRDLEPSPYFYTPYSRDITPS